LKVLEPSLPHDALLHYHSLLYFVFTEDA